MEKGELQLSRMQFAGVYAVYSYSANPPECEYIGLSRSCDKSVEYHMLQPETKDLTHAVRLLPIADTSREALIAGWKSWVEEAVKINGKVPAGNMQGDARWQYKQVTKPKREEIKLTNAKPISVPIEMLIEGVIKENKIVAFVKGTRSSPACGFSHKMMTILNEYGAEYEVVNVLDDAYNPGLRDAIKTFSQWPTIPQLYIKGEFIGGADIVEQMSNKGELEQLVKS
jgi:Grx4 family monothiol glutaredoxin